MRVQPRPLVTVLVAVGYMAIVVAIWSLVGLDYDAVGDSTTTVVEGIVVPVGAGAVYLAAVTGYLGWWRPAIHEDLRAPAWMWSVPALMAVPGVAVLLGGAGPADRSVGFLVSLGAGCLLVGFSEELMTRGTGLVGLRGGFGEPLSWFFSCLLFGLIHALNAFFGQSLASTGQQILVAFLAGSVLYVTRRVAGTLILCMLLHAWIDFTTFAFSDAAIDADSPLVPLASAQWVAFFLAIVGVSVLLRRTGGSREDAPGRLSAT